MNTTERTQDVNSNVNQSIKGKFVGREVYTCFSYEMQAIIEAEQDRQRSRGALSNPLPTWEDVENLCIDCDEHYKDHGYESADDMRDSGADGQEIYEWWIVSSHLYNKLKENGEPVLEWGNNYYWGRTTTGQTILLDGVISRICSDMEILQGQKYSWE